ncbi:hypothetical protein C9374_010736 [Naegleria lovaniensis]|uniref:Uncharacterized protein n=1 Tax=Naegleria lovaniensis TaxID=51637 RepID=A0AA88KJ15_NAELO|nr:uncharacterized protein C9374_010736 [Naegleria lovaniensis]KAG2374452.1 hypothetical protein C9374_010736 [Naegleria lovaniensis]
MKPSAQSSSSSLFSVVSLDQQQQQRPSTSSQPLSDYSSHVQESFRAFKLTRNSDADESESLNDMLQQEYTHPHDHDDDLNENEEISLNNMVDSDDGYTTPTEDAARRLPSLVSENQWIYTTPQRPRGELVCPGAPKRKKSIWRRIRR